MPAVGIDDAPMSYRRGYQHGPAVVLHAVERFLDPLCARLCEAGLKRTFMNGGFTRGSVLPRLGG